MKLSDKQRKQKDSLNFDPETDLFVFLKIPGIVAGGMILSYLIGRFRLNMLFLVFVLYCAYYIFKRRVEKYKRSLLVLDRKHNEKEFESVEWLNHIMKKFWEVSEAGISSEIYNQVNNILLKNKPGFLKSLKLTELTLGTKAPVVETIGYVKESEDKIILVFSANFIPIETSNNALYYFGNEKQHWNTCIELTATVGFVSLPVLVRNFTFSGICKVEINLTRKIPFLKNLRFSLLEDPLVDFELEPLKTVDFMDIPYLSSIIHNIMFTQIRKQLVEPNAVKINIEDVMKYSEKTVGVLRIFVGTLYKSSEEDCFIELSRSGVSFGKTMRRPGKNPRFEETFYVIVTDMMKEIGVGCNSTYKKLHGKIHLRNLNKGIYAEMLHLSDEHTRNFLEVTSEFYEITDEIKNDCIVSLNIVSCQDLQEIGKTKNEVYSTYCVVTLERKQYIRKIVQRYETKRIFASKNPFYNESFNVFTEDYRGCNVKVEIMEENTDRILGKSVFSLEDLRNRDVLVSYPISGMEEGTIQIRYGLLFVNTVRNTVCADNQNTIEVKNRSSDNSPKDKSGIDMIGSILGKRNRDLGIYNFGFEYRYGRYLVVYKIKIVSISMNGLFYLVFETDSENFQMEPFSGDLPIHRSIIVPVRNEKFLKVRLFQMGSNGDIYIDECDYDFEGKLRFGDIEVVLNSKSDVLTDGYKDSDKKTAIFQYRISGGDVVEGEDISRSGFRFESHTDVSVQRNRMVDSENTGFSEMKHNNEIENGTIRTLDVEYYAIRGGKKDTTYRNQVVGATTTTLRELTFTDGKKCFIIPVRPIRDLFYFGKKSFYISSISQSCSMTSEQVKQMGTLEIYVVKSNGVENSTYVKVYYNNEKIHKTKLSEGCYNERLKLEIDRYSDIIGFGLYEENRVCADNIIGYKDVTLFNIQEGYSRYDIKLEDSRTGALSGKSIQVVFHFRGQIF